MDHTKLLHQLAQVDNFEEVVKLYIESRTGDLVDLTENFPGEVRSAFQCVNTFIVDRNKSNFINRNSPDLI